MPNTTKNDKIEYWDQIENLKTNTILGYDANFESVKCWGPSALVNTTERKDINPVELFKLHLSDLDNLDKDKKSNKPYLPSKLVYKKAITDYLREMGKQVKINLDSMTLYHISKLTIFFLKKKRLQER